MQIILTEEEYNELKNSVKIEKEKNKEIIQKLCTEVANNKPVKYWGNEEAHVWGCILTGTVEHCDECPVEDVCPCECKDWSK